MRLKSDSDVQDIFEKYPDYIKPKMLYLRELVFATARQIDKITELEETLKWGEPSYLTKKGSTLRMDWKSRNPNQYALYFKCTSLLIPTIKEVFGDKFRYEKNRAILFDLDESINEEDLRECIKMALTYHTVKHLPLLGYNGDDELS